MLIFIILRIFENKKTMNKLVLTFQEIKNLVYHGNQMNQRLKLLKK